MELTVKQQISIVDNNDCIVIDDIKIRRSDDKKRILLRKDSDNKSKKETNNELITWNSDNNIIYSIKSKKSRHKKYDEIGRHLVEDKELNINNEDDNLPYLVDCKGCEYNIGRKLNKNKCFIYIEKDIAITFKGRSETTEVGGLKTFKPYMTHENIFRQNDLVNKNVVTNICIDKNNNMSIDEEDEDLIDNCLKWLISDEWSLDGMFALEIFAKNSSVEKFNFDGKLRMVKNVKKVYIIALIVAIIILPCNISIDLRIDSAIAEWLTKYSEIGSTRRELDDNLYIYLNSLNTILELKNMTLNILCKTSDGMEDMQEIKLPALKKELIKHKNSIKEIVIKLDNLIVDEHQEVTKKMFSVSEGLPKNGKWRTKVPSGGLPKNGKWRTKVRKSWVSWVSSEKWKKPKFASEEQKTQRFILGGFLKNRKRRQILTDWIWDHSVIWNFEGLRRDWILFRRFILEINFYLVFNILYRFKIAIDIILIS
ncbi:unnamed protein product [Rhizophagus irregularis]|nr:unnamed protein product [Rhizophagus irregularis]